MVGDRLTAFISIKQFFALLDQFGGYNGLKQAGGGGVVAGQLVVGALGGSIVALAGARRYPQSPPRSSRCCGWSPSARCGPRWTPTTADCRPTRRAWPRAFTCLSVTASTACSSCSVSTRSRVTGGSAARRRLLLGAGGIVLGVAANALLLRQFVQWSTFGYDGTEYRGDDVEPITPNERFYSVTKNIV